MLFPVMRSGACTARALARMVSLVALCAHVRLRPCRDWRTSREFVARRLEAAETFPETPTASQYDSRNLTTVGSGSCTSISAARPVFGWCYRCWPMRVVGLAARDC